MRYKFRGKRIDGDSWQYGSLIIHDDGSMAITQGATKFGGQLWSTQALPESVGQWTGLVDRHGKEIFEGDVIYGENYLFPVYDFRKIAVTWNEKSGGFDMDIFDQEGIEIIGNIHDNPELMEVE